MEKDDIDQIDIHKKIAAITDASAVSVGRGGGCGTSVRPARLWGGAIVDVMELGRVPAASLGRLKSPVVHATLPQASGDPVLSRDGIVVARGSAQREGLEFLRSLPQTEGVLRPFLTVRT